MLNDAFVKLLIYIDKFKD